MSKKDVKKVKNKNEEIKEEQEEKQEEIKNSEIELLGNRIKELEEKLVRNQAELINYKRRKDDEVSRMLKYSQEDIILEILPIIDNFERAIKLDDNNLEDELSKFLNGFKMIYTNLIEVLNKYEVKEIEALGKEFDPTYHQAVLTDKDESKASGTILEVLQKGYMYKDKVIRVSMVKVNE
ncbi:MAG: nucleotide exchange factor GrpE [Bacilli bacterium]